MRPKRLPGLVGKAHALPRLEPNQACLCPFGHLTRKVPPGRPSRAGKGREKGRESEKRRREQWGKAKRARKGERRREKAHNPGRGKRRKDAKRARKGTKRREKRKGLLPGVLFECLPRLDPTQACLGADPKGSYENTRGGQLFVAKRAKKAKRGREKAHEKAPAARRLRAKRPPKRGKGERAGTGGSLHPPCSGSPNPGCPRA